MIILAALVIGGLLGWRRAAALGGNVKDRALYILVFALIFALVGLFVTILIDRAT
ncbi:hypothetical protein [Paracoccus suum]|uniref:hypothetical protein n=1 Tax=Paracoccus suum TaxID=2259340 RepID=UPI0018F039FF|nr:hypothetical protein [Paracoccus suum]